MTLLEVAGLTVGVTRSPTSILANVSFSIPAGKIVGLVGESGSGKTMAALTIMGLLPDGIEVRSGRVRMDGRQLMDPANLTLRRRSEDMAMIFQHPQAALNPTMKVGRQIARVFSLQQGSGRSEAMSQSIEMLRRVGIPGATRVAQAHPHQLSGGMCQRVMIAMALACRPRILIADEPTTALDVTIQAQIFDLIRDLVAETGAGVLFITHDLAAVAEMCDSVTVLFGGQVMEEGSRDDIFRRPQHPYTSFLLDSVQQEVDPDVVEAGVDFELVGCRFGHRCRYAWEACGEVPDLFSVGAGHRSACFLHTVGENRVGTS
ncbi:MAG: ABC transporter ATP-binding protein [bacterium]|nr:ABC transporter ATP-binding protein [Acidimicrobiia bacterium]MCY4650045.1 ABC transporter ATP-binding protein [bacterium]